MGQSKGKHTQQSQSAHVEGITKGTVKEVPSYYIAEGYENYNEYKYPADDKESIRPLSSPALYGLKYPHLASHGLSMNEFIPSRQRLG